MRKHLCVLLASLALAAGAASAADQPAADATHSLERVATDVQNLLGKERVHSQFDLFRRLRDYGVTWQPALLAPSDLVSRLDDEKLRFYAGVKLFDLMYAATFMQRQAVLDALQTIEAIQDKLDLRASADLSGAFTATIRQAASNPQLGDVQGMIDQLAAAYIQDVPALMSTPETADYLIDSLYGFTVTNLYVLGYFVRNDTDNRLRDGLRQQPDRLDWLETLVDLFKAFGRMDDTIKVNDQLTHKVAVIEQMVAALKSGDTSGAVEVAAWQEVRPRVAAISASMLNAYTE